MTYPRLLEVIDCLRRIPAVTEQHHGRRGHKGSAAARSASRPCFASSMDSLVTGGDRIWVSWFALPTSLKGSLLLTEPRFRRNTA